MSVENIRAFIKEEAKKFGGEIGEDYIERNNTKDDAFNKGRAYFGIISTEEEHQGPYHDFSIVIFPSRDIGKSWILALGVGSMGFKNDYELASYPGLRRLFSKIIKPDNGYIKSDFSNIEDGLPKEFFGRKDIIHLKKAIDNSKGYGKVLPAIQILEDLESDETKKIISAFLAIYAKIKNWNNKSEFSTKIDEALEPFLASKSSEITDELFKLITERKYIVLQGAPGTGKTRTAKLLGEKLTAEKFFIQFHAETSYSDFISGLRPKINSNVIGYEIIKGEFVKAIEFANKHENTNVLLIIDEINRANLANVLGPIFYLFEHKMDISNVKIEISPDLKIKQLPKNLYVIATMNTADRSLAVVDFALRRRFAWYTVKPTIIAGNSKKIDNTEVIQVEGTNSYFFIEDFNKISTIFNWYATSNELSLQPGQGYFIANNVDEMKDRIRYEIFPLIKEYLEEGLIRNAKEEFNNYFTTRINQSLFE
ncbi:McrB family protein [Flavobacterium chilense]|uniref:AAA domain (Dynein-related subfamily) n=1 Tax=Flavobacterium chilense TaxID=946677 RepID=A0A1M7KVQ2_9FLAO|nr:AAA family ATPase [Flavobacterium chilense]SHM69661.1 AAA domain (dynein-related subfamily) [Flavobacterium chilense]